jgi:hypothetical protein
MLIPSREREGRETCPRISGASRSGVGQGPHQLRLASKLASLRILSRKRERKKR